MFRRLLCVALLLGAQSSWVMADSVPAAGKEVPALSQQERQARIDSVTDWYGSMVQTPDAKLQSAARSMAIQYTLQLGPGMSGWGPANPNWKQVHDQVSRDIAEDILQIRKSSGKELDRQAIGYFVDALPGEDVAALNRFAKSSQGQRYWKLTMEVANLVTETVSRANVGEWPQPKVAPTPEEMKSWERLLQASNGTRMMLAMIEKDKQAGQDNSAGIKVLWELVISARSEEFKRLAATYQSDLPAFEQFNESPLGKRQIDALVATSMAMMPKMSELIISLQKQINTHRPAWQQLYATATAGSATKP